MTGDELKAVGAFEVATGDRELTVQTTDVTVYLDHALTSHAEALTKAVDAFLTLVSRDALTWYRTDAMTRGKPCTARSLAIPKTWFRPGSAFKVHRFLQVQDGTAYASVPRCGFRISSHELEAGEPRPWEPSLVRFMLPAAASRADPAPLLQLAQQLADDFPIVSGHSRYCIERNDAYYSQPSMMAAYPLAMRFQGADLDYRLSDEEFVFLKTVNWLTIVGDPLLERIGGRAALCASINEPEVIVHDAKFGLILQAGERPALGDVNRGEWLPSYRAVYRALAELFAPTFTPAFHLTIPGDPHVDEERTEAWYRRFEREIERAGSS